MSQLAKQLIETLTNDDETVYFGNKELSRNADFQHPLTLERLCYIAKLYGWKLAISEDGVNWQCFGERAHEFVKKVGFAFFNKHDNEFANDAIIKQELRKLYLEDNYLDLSIKHRVSPKVDEFERMADSMGFKFTFLKRTNEDIIKDRRNDEF
jgi:hypothetical protein